MLYADITVARGWWEAIDRPEGRFVMMLAATAFLIAFGYYLISKFRSAPEDSNPSVSDVLASFRDLQEQGELSDEEFRSIKTKLSGRMQDELKRPAPKEPRS